MLVSPRASDPLHCAICSGSTSSDDAKIGGITPDVFSRSGK
jgi:hypothetical protein